MNTLRERIEFVKKATKWSNAELARRARVSRAAPTDWLNGSVGVLSSVVAQNLSQQTPFTAGWLATGSKPMYKAESEIALNRDWPFLEVDEEKVRNLQGPDKAKLEAALLIAAGHVGLDIKKNS